MKTDAMRGFFLMAPLSHPGNNIIPAIILDFDGVVLESVSVKTDAFRQLFSFSPDHVDEIVQFHIDNGGMSRFDKFRHIYTTILHKHLSEDEFNRLSQQFSQLVEEAVINAPFVEGTLDLLEAFFKKCNLYIVSATPEEELRRIVHLKGISGYFSGIFGSPRKKADHIRRIITAHGVDPSQILFIGDAPNDWQAARESGVRFIARIQPEDKDRFVNLPSVELKISNMYDLKTYLEKNTW